MQARVVTITGASDIDAGVKMVKEKVVPAAKEQNGYRGLSVSADRAAAVVAVLSLWETEADLAASDPTMQKLRDEAVPLIGGQISVERYEQIFAEAAGAPGPGATLAVSPISMEPSKIDDNLEFFKSSVLPGIKSIPGFRAVRVLMNRQTGKGSVGVVAADAEGIQAGLAARRTPEQAAQRESRGIQLGEASVREILFADFG